MNRVKHVILVKSVKGGVGKSTVSTQLALSLWDAGYKVTKKKRIELNLLLNFHEILIACSQVGLLDIDLCGPSIPYLMDVEGRDGEY